MKGTILAAALIAGLISTANTATAADLGGNCCADLEDRIAELEATTARKGNRKMSLTVYGSVNQALLWADIDGESDSAIGNNANFSSRFGFKGETKVREGFKAGFVIEVGVGGFDADAGSFDDYLSNDIGLRHAFVYVDTGVGKFAIGQASSATDGIAEITIANTVVASKLLSFEHIGIPAVFDGGRGHAVRYDTPSLAGFVGSASITSDDPTMAKSFVISAVVVMLCSLWPTLINTAIGTASIDKDLINVGRVLRLGWFARLTKLVLPSSLPYIFTGMRLSLGVGWMVLIAAEMLAQNPGLGKFVWDEFQNGNDKSLARIMVAVVVIGLIGFVLDRVMMALQAFVSRNRTF